MRQTVRALAAKPVASAMLVVAMMIGAAVVAVETSGDDPAPTAPADVEADPDATTPAGVSTQQEDRNLGLAGAVAGFGLISVWLVALGVGIRRARRRQALRGATTTDKATAP